jgi:hypothetical protein
MRLMTSPASALVVLAVLLMHGSAFGQKDETTHGPPAMNSTGGRNATWWWDGECYDGNDCHWDSCTSCFGCSTCGDDEVQPNGESRNSGCWNSWLGLGEEDRCCRKLPNCRCGAYLSIVTLL